MAHDCENCGELCYCDGEDLGGQPAPEDCQCPCYEGEWEPNEFDDTAGS
jgi:hypothetical protein